MRNFVDVTYDPKRLPFTAYPDKLACYLFDRYCIKPCQKLLDIGCGRGEFLRGFIDCGAKCYGVDRSRAAEKYCPEAELLTTDLENDRLPFEDNFFDIIFPKSVIEHLYYPEKLFSEIQRILKPGGLVITMCPNWKFNYCIYFEDFTYRTPFMQSSLRDIQITHGLENVRVERFRQLPVLWVWGWLLPLAELTRLLTPSILKSYSKWVRFSKEIMLLSSPTKPFETAVQKTE